MEELRDALVDPGWILVPGAFTAAELEPLKAAFDRLEDRARGLASTETIDGTKFVIEPTGQGGAPSLQRVVWAAGAEPGLLEPADDPRIYDRVVALLGTEVTDQLINQAHFKRPHDGVAFPFHQDAWNRRHGRLFDDVNGWGSYVQVVLTLDPMTHDNGPLSFLPHTHALGPVDVDASSEERSTRVAELIQEHPPVEAVAPAGSLLFFGPYVFHGSEPNRSDRPRRILINGFAVAGCNRREYPGAGLGLRRTPVAATVPPAGTPTGGSPGSGPST